MILNERLLQIVLTLAEELHFGRAAARLYVSQPALSGAVKSLERELGVCLFRRTSRHVELTEAGRVFAAEARRLIAESQRAVGLIRGSSPEILGPLRIGYPASMDLRWFCSLISSARRDMRVSAGFDFVSTEGTHLDEHLIQRTLHAAVFAGRLCHPDLHCVSLFREPFRVVLSSGNSLGKLTALRLDQLANEPVVWLRREANPSLYDGFAETCASQGFRLTVSQEVSNFRECLEFARAGLGITFLPAFLRGYESDSSLVFALLQEARLYAEYGIACARNHGSRDLDRFLDFVQHFASQKRTSAFENRSTRLIDSKKQTKDTPGTGT